MTHGSATRAAFDAAAATLVGNRLLEVRYSDVYNFGPEARVWDYGNWHHAVMGVELLLDSGPASIVWTSAFHPHGVEILREPISDCLSMSSQGPETWDVGEHPAWRECISSAIDAASFFWDRIVVGPGYRLGDGTRVSEAYAVEVPVALRLDFTARSSPVWFVSAIPAVSEPDTAFVHGDEVMIIFDTEKMRRLGFPAGEREPRPGPPDNVRQGG